MAQEKNNRELSKKEWIFLLSVLVVGLCISVAALYVSFKDFKAPKNNSVTGVIRGVIIGGAVGGISCEEFCSEGHFLVNENDTLCNCYLYGYEVENGS